MLSTLLAWERPKKKMKGKKNQRMTRERGGVMRAKRRKRPRGGGRGEANHEIHDEAEFMMTRSKGRERG